MSESLGATCYEIAEGVALTTEVTAQHVEDRGGSLARVDGRLRVAKGLALPGEETPLVQHRNLSVKSISTKSWPYSD
jgi:hypothetical protein